MSEPNGPGDKGHANETAREVTDPITHLPLTVHDADSTELEQIPSPLSVSEEKKREEKRGADSKEDTNERHSDMEAVVREATDGNWVDDPIGNQRRTRIQTSAAAAGAAAVGALGGLILWSAFDRVFLGRGRGASLGWLGFVLAPVACLLLGLGVGAAGLLLGVMQRDTKASPPKRQPPPSDDRQKTLNRNEASPESAEWLNSFLHSLWPIVNPSLFTSISDMLEDTMQATLPKMVHGVRVADIGQGSEAVRILGIRWLDAGSAAKDVDGMKAEEGDFINMEIALAYRAKETTSKGIRGRSANAHLLMEFYVAGGITIPVWVDLTGFLATARVRFQLTPNPPFLSLMTTSLLGLPKVTLKCTPLAKNFFNVMDVPGLSNWLQSSINLAVEEYVAPRSLNMDLKTLLMGRPKMDTDAVGVVVVTIRRAEGFKDGDEGKVLKSSEGKRGDAYVSIGWSKWGKPLWSTRIISAGEPVWEETTALLVGPAELNAQECLQLQLWDSDRFTADDLLGNVDVPLKNIMSNEESKNKMSVRNDGLVNDKGKQEPGKLHWEVGYFAKTTFDQHLEHKRQDAEKMRGDIEQEAENKLREAKARDDTSEDSEVKQQKKEDLKERSDEVIAGSKPTAQWPSGILSVTIEQISGLEVQKVRESGVKEDADEEDADLPSSYCTIMINQQRVYKTRTKMKSNNPFFDAGTEKFIRDWRTTDVIIAVRDNRMHEADAVIGIVVLPLRDVFKHNSQFTDSLPLVGGIGYGRMRLSLTFRSVQLQLPKRLLGWDVGTLEVHPQVKPSSNLPEEYAKCRLVFRTVWGKGKMVPSSDRGWEQKAGKPVRLAVKKRYASCVLIQLRKHHLGPDQTPAFATLWLKEIPDDEEVHLSLPVRKNADSSSKDDVLVHARQNASMDSGEQIGFLDLTVRLWPGLSGYHKHLADHDKNMADVMEVLDYAEGSQDSSQELLQGEGEGGDEEYDTSSSSSSSSSSSDDEDDSEPLDDNSSSSSSSSSSSDDEDDSEPLDDNSSLKNGGLAKKDGVPREFKEFRKRKGELHRKHRGLMQWKAARQVAWVGRGVEETAEKVGGKVKGAFQHHEKEAGIEKEV